MLLGAARRFRGDASGAIDYIDVGLDAARARGDAVGTCIALYNLGESHLGVGRMTSAEQHLKEAALLCEQTGDAATLSLILHALAEAEAGTSQPERVAGLLGAAESTGHAAGSSGYGFYASEVARRQDACGETRRRRGDAAYERAFEYGWALTLQATVRWATEGAWTPAVGVTTHDRHG